ncbi:hypothetical protein [Rhodococcus marinonascens]|uniref:hypothetical protein n=1 Tax=Rhodococcus marinonascens TaxID=38311 RepID=UPI00093473AC|nr:hypothetical protein [Rhodococcus marinonascens]
MGAIPFAPGAVREFLLSTPEFTALIPAESVTTRELPDPITGPAMTIRSIGNVGVDPMLRRPLLALNVWVPKWEILGGDTDPDEVAWNIAATAGQLLGRARNVSFRGATWTGGWKTGPINDVDVKRGVDNPLYRAFVTVELKMRESH